MVRIVDGKEINVNIDNLNEIEKSDLINSLEGKMKDAAKKMKFEVALIYRDKIKQIKKGALD